MIGIRAIGAYVPDAVISNYERAESFGVDSAFIDGKLGITKVSRMAAGEDTANMCERAFDALCESKSGIIAGDIDCLIVCTQNPDGEGLPHTSAVLHGRLGLNTQCSCFDISLGCTGYVHSLSIARAFMEANGLEHGVLFTADPYSKIVDPADKNTAMIFGDAATVTLLTPSSADEPLLTPLAMRFHCEGARGEALRRDAGVLKMNGAAVFNFSATAVPKEVTELLATLSLRREEIDLFLLHQGSKYIVDAIRNRLGLPGEKVPIGLTECGNAVSSSIPLMLRHVIDDDSIEYIVLSGFGVGLAVATAVLGRRC